MRMIRNRRRSRSLRPDLETLDAIVLLSIVDMTSATETDAQTLSVGYDLSSDVAALTLNVYRSADATFDPASDVFVGSQALEGANLTSGTHTAVPISLTTPLANGAPPLSPDPAHPYVFVAATGPDDISSSASFRKFLFGVVTHGFSTPGTTSLPTWVTTMASSLQAAKYDAVIPFNWVVESYTLQAGEGLAAGDRLAKAVQTYLTTPGNVPAGAVVDFHFIGHSRGSVVITQAFTQLQSALSSLPQYTGGYWRETLLDPHPANSPNVVPFTVVAGKTGKDALDLANKLQAIYQDPFPLPIPSAVAEVQNYFERTPADEAPYFNAEELINPTGLFQSSDPKTNGIVTAPGAKTVVQQLELTTPGIVHEIVHDWYQVNVVPKLSGPTGFINGPVAAPIYATAYNFSAVAGIPVFLPPTPGGISVDNPNEVASDMTATIDWGDGTTPSVAGIHGFTSTGFLVTATHSYANAGTYTTTLTVTDRFGASSVSHATAKVSSWRLDAVGASPGSAPVITLKRSDTGATVDTFLAYPTSFLGGVSVIQADVNGDGTPDFIVAPVSVPRRTAAPPVKVIDGVTRNTLFSGTPFGPRYRGFIHLDAGDLTADGRAEVVVSNGREIRTLDGKTFAFLDRIPGRVLPGTGSTPGLNVADVNNDGFDDVTTLTRRNGSYRVIDGLALNANRAARALRQFRRDLIRRNAFLLLQARRALR